MDHPFHGDPQTDPACSWCGEPYETADQRHDFGKLITRPGMKIRPYVLSDYDREARELGMPTWAEVK